ncbi:MAG: hypothetical protein ACK522_04395 [Synechococcaceae cyanobacterium]
MLRPAVGPCLARRGPSLLWLVLSALPVAAQPAEGPLALPACRAALGLPASASAAMPATPACAPPEDPLARLERLEQQLQASRQRIAAQQAQLAAETARQDALAQDLALLRQQLRPAAAQPAPAVAPAAGAATPEPLIYTPGRGFTLRAGGATLQLGAEARLLGFSTSRFTINAGQPLVVSPKDPAASYDLSAQQSTVTASFQGPKWGEWTPGGFALFTLQDNLLAEGYSFTPVAFVGEISNGRWRFVAGQTFDVFAPRDPDTLPNGRLASSGNPGAYRPQFRVEHSFRQGSDFEGLLQVAGSAPITTALPKNLDLATLPDQELVEDNGWPNAEARFNLGFGPLVERAGGRRLRALELGVSGVVGQLRVLDNIRATAPLTLVSDRSEVTVWGAALDGRLAIGRSVGLSGELYTGQALGEYMAGIFQTYNRATNAAVPTSGGWVQLSVHPSDQLRLAVGYAMDNATDAGLFSLQANSTAFANVVWDVNPWLQLGLEGNYKLTTYDSFGDKNAWVVISEVLFRL